MESNQSSNELVSIVVTSYNHAEYLAQRMDSILNQTYPETEIVVVDDCSTDNSAEILKQYEGRGNVTLRLLEENTGYANACNLGVSLSKGRYVIFAECDDFDEPEHISVLVDKLRENDTVGVAFSCSNMVDENGEVRGRDFEFREKSFKNLCENDTLISKEQMQRFLLISCVVPNMSAALVRREYFDMVEGLSDRYKVCADWDFWCRISRFCDFYYVTEPLNNFRTHSTTVRSTAPIAPTVCEIYELLYNAMDSTELSVFEALRFRLNIAFIWANYISTNPLSWFVGFPIILKEAIKHSKLSLLYLFLGLAKKAGYGLNKFMKMVKQGLNL